MPFFHQIFDKSLSELEKRRLEFMITNVRGLNDTNFTNSAILTTLYLGLKNEGEKITVPNFSKETPLSIEEMEEFWKSIKILEMQNDKRLEKEKSEETQISQQTPHLLKPK
jgi:hypothetical protein